MLVGERAGATLGLANELVRGMRVRVSLCLVLGRERAAIRAQAPKALLSRSRTLCALSPLLVGVETCKQHRWTCWFFLRNGSFLGPLFELKLRRCHTSSRARLGCEAERRALKKKCDPQTSQDESWDVTSCCYVCLENKGKARAPRRLNQGRMYIAKAVKISRNLLAFSGGVKLARK